MKVVRWTEWNDDYHFDYKDIEEVSKAVAAELRSKGYHFDGHYHQNGDYGVPVLDDGRFVQVTQRSWGGIMAMAYPEEFDNLEDPYNYVIWYLGPEDRSKYVFPEGNDDE